MIDLTGTLETSLALFAALSLVTVGATFLLPETGHRRALGGEGP